MDCPKTRDAEAVAELPDDPLVEILSRVPFKSLCRCKCVSKAWRDLIIDPLNRKKLPQTLEGFFFVVDSCVENNSDGDYRDGRDIRRDGGGDDSDRDDGDVEDSRSDGGDSNNLRCLVSVHFVDVFGRAPLPVGHYFPCLTELPGIEETILLGGCNGLLLFGCIQRSGKSLSTISYIVSNPATEQWVAVPSPDTDWLYSSICLVFDPAASSHFYLVEVTDLFALAVRIYSNSGVWSPVGIDLGDFHSVDDDRHLEYMYSNGMLYLVFHGGMNQIVVMDMEGKIRKIIPVPLQQEGDEFRLCCDYVGVSQGRLHFIYHAELDCYNLDYDEITPENQSYELSTWVLEDYDTEEWVLKDTVSSLKLFGSTSPGMNNVFRVVAIHPDRDLVFLIQNYKDEHKLLSYNMDSKEVCRLCTLGTAMAIYPYVPYFLELSALENKH